MAPRVHHVHRDVGVQRPGFTLLETVLALTLSSLVLLSAFAVMGALAMAERQLAADHRNVNDLANAQTVLRRTFMQLRMDPEATTMPELTQAVVDQDSLDNPPDPQTFRIILTEDLSESAIESMRYAAPGPISVARRPQRLEVVVNPTPVPPRGGLDPNQGSAVRGVYDLRPDGWREHRIAMARARLGEGPEPESPTPPMADGWTLWWTPLAGAGVTITPLSYDEDTLIKSRVNADEASVVNGAAINMVGGLAGAADMATRTAVYTELDASPDAIALVRGLSSFRIQLFRQRVMHDEMMALAEGDMPAYASVSMATVGGRSAEWLLEIGWETGDDPMMIDDDASLDQEVEGDERTVDDDNGGGAGGGNRGRGGGRTVAPVGRGGRGGGR